MVAPNWPRPLRECAESVRARCRGVFTDIDDTLTTNGQLHAGAYRALERLHQAGLLVVPVTGRPAGWCDHIARMWPVDGVVGENGALYMRYDASRRRMLRVFAVEEAVRAEQRAQLDALAARILAEVPGTALASDQAYRACDLAIDYCEDVPPLAPEAVRRIVELFESAGATAKVSSIHVNGWFGAHDKLSMLKRFVLECHQVELERERDHYVYLGDSPNDEPMFGFFPNAIGVSNVLPFLDDLAHRPRFVTAAAASAGFCEAVDWLLAP